VKFLRVTAIVFICALAAAPLFITPTVAQAQTGGQNLLVDGDFEAPPTWPQQDGIGEVQVAPGWRAWYLDVPPNYVQIPANCNERSDGYHCYWMRPEFRDNTSFDNRIHSGARSQKYFSYGRMHEAGLYQRVGGIRPGDKLRFAIFIQAWQCFNIDKCGKNGILSDLPAEMHLRIGIDPTGGTNPFSPDIVWSPEQAAFDRWVEFSVEAVAKNDTVTVFTHSRPDWSWARLNNDVYLDDASLVVVSEAPAYQPVSAEARAAYIVKETLKRLKQYRRAYWHPDCDTPDCYDVDILGVPSILEIYKPAPAALAASTSITPSVALSVTSSVSASTTLTVATSVTATVSISATPTLSGAPLTYVVSEGDTLFLIAERFNTTMEALVKANNLTNIDFVWTGQVLVIP